MDQGSIVCLQEVSEQWAAQLHAVFQNNGYHFVHRLYGPPFQGYMGVGIAFSNARYNLVDADIVRVSDTRNWPKVAKPSDAPLARAGRAIVDFVRTVKRSVLRQKPYKPPTDPVVYARKRFNTLVSVRLAPKTESNNNLVVTTYHMPCAYFAPPVMNMHVALCARRAIEFAKDDALVLCGDFNIKPHDPGYEILTKGELKGEHREEHTAAMAKAETPDDWSPSLGLGEKDMPFRSAYFEHLGTEPNFTNYAMNHKDVEPFIDCLDYIFVRDGAKASISVTDTRAMPHRNEITDGPYPNDTEMSDHALLRATLSLD